MVIQNGTQKICVGSSPIPSREDEDQTILKYNTTKKSLGKEKSL